MESLRKLEVTFGTWLRDVPHLPVNLRKWLAENVWWLVIVSLVLSAMAILGILAATVFVGVIGSGYSPAAGIVLGGAVFMASLLFLAMFIVMTVLQAMAVGPLKALQKRGWDLLFLVALISLISGVIVSFLTFDLGGIIRSVFGAGVAYYFLYEIVSYFAPNRARKSVSTKQS